MSAADVRRAEIAARLREAREYLALSQDDVATALGLPRPSVTNMEAGTRKVDALELEQLAKLYGRPVSYFLEGASAETEKRVAFVARKLSGLSDKDLQEVERFAEFLKLSATKKPGRR